MGDFYHQGKKLQIGIQSGPKKIGVHWKSIGKNDGKGIKGVKKAERGWKV